MRPLIPILVLSIIILASSCISHKKLIYLQSPSDSSSSYELMQVSENIIKPNDELYITVTSVDDPVFNFLGAATDNMQAGLSNDMSVTLLSYTVQLDGQIQFPIIGKVFVSGLTLDQARENLEEKLQAYLNQPSAKIKFSYKKVSILGEVSRPGNYTYSKDRLNILEALAIGGDLTIHGDRKEIYLLREQNNKLIKVKIDLTQDDLLISPYYYIQADDILYVKPRKSKKWDVVSIPITLVVSTLTASLLVLNYFGIGQNPK